MERSLATRLARGTSLITPIRFAPAVAAYAALLAQNGEPEAGFRVLVALAVLGVTIAILKLSTWKTRPNGEAPHGLSLGAFPSGHSAFAWFLVPVLLYTLPLSYGLSAASSAAVVALLVGTARIHIRCHTRMQVLIGALVGLLVPWLIFVVA